MIDKNESNYQDVADLRAENAKLRAEVAALKAHPSDAEIEAWRSMWERRFRGDGLELGEDAALLEEAVALMRRFRAAPSSALVERILKDKIVGHGDGTASWPARREGYNAACDNHAAMVRAALAAEPEAHGAAVCKHEFVPTKAYGERFLRCKHCGHYNSARRETLEQEVARLYGLTGPDGKGRV